MDQITSRMRAVTDDPPPSGIDIDKLIDDEYRRTRRLRWSAGAAVAAAGLAALLAVALVPADPAPSTRVQAPGAPPAAAAATTPRVPGAAQDGAAAALTAQLTPRLSALLPGATLSDPRSPGAPAPWFTGTPENGYDAVVWMSDAAGGGHMTFNYLLRMPPCTTQPDCERPPPCPFVDGDTSCTLRGDGTKVLVMRVHDGTMKQHQIGIYRPDGVIVQLSSGNWRTPDMSAGKRGATSVKSGQGWTDPEITRPEPALTVDQLVAIADALRV